MNKMALTRYAEIKPHRIKMILWRILNVALFPLLDRYSRIWLLRFFGAKVGSRCLFYRSIKVYAPWNLEVGDMVCIGPRVDLFCKAMIRIGSGIVISQDSYLCTATHDYTSPLFESVVRPVVIMDNSWVAARASVLPGVTVGEGAIIGACAVVSRDVPSWSVAAGNPARVVKKRELYEA